MEEISLYNEKDENILEYLLFHPLSFEISLLAIDRKFNGISISGNIEEKLIKQWLLSLHNRSRLGIFENVNIIDTLEFRRVEKSDRIHIFGTCLYKEGSKIFFDTESPLIDILDCDGNIVNKHVLAEPFPKGYKILYDNIL